MRERSPVRTMLIVTAMILMVQGIVGWRVFTATEQPARAAFVYGNITGLGETALCPGDVLTYTLEMMYRQAGVYEVDTTTWRMTPPRTVVFSSVRRAVIAEPVELLLPFAWTVPATYYEPQTGRDVPLGPGQYERRHAVTTSSRSTQPAIVSVPFTIREGCDD